MALSPGTQIGPYQIVDQIGAGGMGEVYRATDTKLGRDIAIKTLPSALAQEPDRLARFEREAKLLATLNHAHIGTIYGLDEHEGTQFIAMELIEGQTLEEKLKDGALPVEDALRIALQIAEALEAAHEKGVMHRDLKPANVMLTPDGVVKVLDFGLAKAFAGDPNAVSPAHSPALSVAMTQQGLILGTAGYMSPEQASGQATDQRADIWAFGVVLYEMLTGLPLFSGESVPHILADVLRTEPNWNRLPKSLHPRLRLLLERCLKKKVRDRCHAIADVRIDIEEVLKDPEGVAVGAAMAPPRQPYWRRVLPVAAAVLITGLVVGVGVRSLFSAAVSPAETDASVAQDSRPVRRFSLDLSRTAPIANTSLNAHIALSPDGRRLAYAVDVGGGQTQLFVRELDQTEARAVPDSAGAQHPFFSPDGDWVAFFADGTDNQLKRVAFRGGPAQALAEINGAGGGYWGEDGNIVYSTNPDGIRSLLRVPASGGVSEYLLPQPEPGADGDVWPAALPGGRALLFVLRPRGNGPIQDGNIAFVSLETGETSVLIRGAHRPQYVPTGHIVFVRSGALWAVPFDAERLEITGPEVAVIDNVQQNGQIGGAAYAFSTDGLLVYLEGSESGGAGLAPRELVWVDRQGREQPLGAEPRPYYSPRLSPDGQRLAVTVRTPTSTDIWINDLVRGTSSRLTFDAPAQTPLWTPDGERVMFWSGFAGTGGIQAQAANGTGQAEQITTSQFGGNYPAAFSPDGNTLVYEQGTGGVLAYDLYVMSFGDETGSDELLATNNNDCCAAISPDGHWLAYGSNETGQLEIYVRPFPNVEGGKWQVSNDGGTEPRWRADGSELFFLAAGATWSVAVDDAAGFAVGTPVELFSGNYWASIDTHPNYDVTPDGQRFLMMKAPGAAETDRYSQQTPLTTVENWFEELRRLAPPD